MKKILFSLVAILILACNTGSPYSAEPLSSAGEVVSSDMSSAFLSGSSSECACSVEIASSSSGSSSSAEISSSSSFLDFWADIPYEDGILTDDRDGSIYRTIDFPVLKKIWMVDNLNYAAEGSSVESSPNVDDYCYLFRTDAEIPCILSGRLYSLTDTLDPCPPKWHLPTSKEWEGLFGYMFRDHRMTLKTLEIPAFEDADLLFGIPNSLDVSYILHFWAAPEKDSLDAFAAVFMSNYVWLESMPRTDKYRIRCVQDYSDAK